MSPLQNQTFRPISPNEESQATFKEEEVYHQYQQEVAYDEEASNDSTVPGLLLPTDADIDAELSKLMEQVSTSKESYETKQEKLSRQLESAQSKVAPLDQEFEKASKKLEISQRKMDAVRRRRDFESAKIRIRQAHLDLLKLSCEESATSTTAREIVKTTTDIGGQAFLKPETLEELVTVRDRLESCFQLFAAAIEREDSKDFEVKLFGGSMKRRAYNDYCALREEYQVA